MSALAMSDFASEAWQTRDKSASDALVRSPLPILYVGDTAAYDDSSRRIVTVGIHPGPREFPENEPLARFPTMEPFLRGERNSRFYEQYMEALNRYFSTVPCAAPYESLEPLLNGMDAGYYGGRIHTALHTNLCSPLATELPWRDLNPMLRVKLQSYGVRLWHRLIDRLRPDVILAYLAEGQLANLLFPALSVSTVLCSTASANPYTFSHRLLNVHPAGPTHLVAGRTGRTRFQDVSAGEKTRAGAEIIQRLDEILDRARKESRRESSHNDLLRPSSAEKSWRFVYGDTP